MRHRPRTASKFERHSGAADQPPQHGKDIRAFDRVPFSLYADSPYWVPPVSGEVGEALDGKRHPYYQHSEAAFFVAERDGKAVGRIGICHHRPFHESQKIDAAYFCFFETVDDKAVAAALLDATGDWTRQRGLKQQIGPIDFFQGNGFGALVEGFDEMPVPGIPYNAPYMDDLLKGLGLTSEMDVLSGTLTEKGSPPANLMRMADQLAKDGGIRILHPKNKKELKAWLPRAGRLFEATHIPGQINVPMTEAEWEHLVAHFWPVIDPELVKLAVTARKSSGRCWPTSIWARRCGAAAAECCRLAGITSGVALRRPTHRHQWAPRAPRLPGQRRQPAPLPRHVQDTQQPASG